MPDGQAVHASDGWKFLRNSLHQQGSSVSAAVGGGISGRATSSGRCGDGGNSGANRPRRSTLYQVDKITALSGVK